jgi:hypothetical protein
LDPQHEADKSQTILQAALQAAEQRIKEKRRLMHLPTDILNRMFTLLPFHMLSRCATINRYFRTFFGKDNQNFWLALSSQTNFPISLTSLMKPLDQLNPCKNPHIKTPIGVIHLLRHHLILDIPTAEVSCADILNAMHNVPYNYYLSYHRPIGEQDEDLEIYYHADGKPQMFVRKLFTNQSSLTTFEEQEGLKNHQQTYNFLQLTKKEVRILDPFRDLTNQ